MTKTTNDATVITLTPKVSLKFNRCVAITLPDGREIVCKVLGEKIDAAAGAKMIVAAFAVEVN